MACIFDPQRLHDAARRVVGLSHRLMVRELVDSLVADYPDHIEPTENWIMSLGGALGS